MHHAQSPTGHHALVRSCSVVSRSRSRQDKTKLMRPACAWCTCAQTRYLRLPILPPWCGNSVLECRLSLAQNANERLWLDTQRPRREKLKEVCDTEVHRARVHHVQSPTGHHALVRSCSVVSRSRSGHTFFFVFFVAFFLLLFFSPYFCSPFFRFFFFCCFFFFCLFFSFFFVCFFFFFVFFVCSFFLLFFCLFFCFLCLLLFFCVAFFCLCLPLFLPFFVCLFCSWQHVRYGRTRTHVSSSVQCSSRAAARGLALCP